MKETESPEVQLASAGEATRVPPRHRCSHCRSLRWSCAPPDCPARRLVHHARCGGAELPSPTWRCRCGCCSAPDASAREVRKRRN
eukprot:10435-Hanusia_phi.AAC.1